MNLLQELNERKEQIERLQERIEEHVKETNELRNSLEATERDAAKELQKSELRCAGLISKNQSLQAIRYEQQGKLTRLGEELEHLQLRFQIQEEKHREEMQKKREASIPGPENSETSNKLSDIEREICDKTAKVTLASVDTGLDEDKNSA